MRSYFSRNVRRKKAQGTINCIDDQLQNGENVYIGDEVIQILANDGYIDLNCETHNAYDASGFCNGYVKSEDFPDLKPGKNHIAWSGAIDHVEITPRWWTL